ncbi:MAG: helix-turn-helix transcriptional regulator [Acidobacteria bacterium]|nr:helix-turn-helix transcriptional regulator [Acidobacteriota bacterium]
MSLKPHSGPSTARQRGVNVDEMVSLFYDAILAPELWAESVRQLAACFGNAVTSLTCFRGGAGESLTGASDPDSFRLYNEYYGALDPHAARLPRDAPVGLLGVAEELVRPAELERTPYYNEFMKPLNMYYGVGGVLRSDENGTEILSLFRARSQGPFSLDEQRVLGLLCGHLRRARTVYYRIQALTEQSGLLRGSLDALRSAVVICDERGRIMVANTVAAEELKGGALLSIAAGGLLAPAAPHLRQRFLSSMRRASAGEPGCIAVPRAWPLPPLILNCAPLPHRGPVKRILVIWEPSRLAQTEEVQPATLCTALGITPSEARVALLITSGCRTNTVAERLKVQPNTVRVHLKRVFAKTGTTGRADLARLILSVTASLRILRTGP